MNKKLLGLAIAAGIAGASSSAVAVDFTAASPDAATIATEQTIGASGLIINGALVTAQFAAGFSIDDTNVSYVRFDLSGGTFSAQQVDGGTEITTSNAGGITHTISAGGSTTDSYVIYQVVGTANAIAPTDTVTFTPTGIVATGAPVSITYGLFEKASDAVSNTNSLATDNGTLIDFAAANSTAADSVTTPQINVTTTTGTGAVFVGGNPALIGAVNTTDTASVFTNATGVAANTAVVEASANLTVTGDFTFTQDLVAGVPNGTYAAASVWADPTSTCTDPTNGTAATSITASAAVIPISGAGVNYICANGNGVSLIAEQTFTGSYASDGAVGFSDETTALTLGTLTKNGATDTQDLVLTPGGAFKNFLRVVNTSNLSGDVSFQLVADDGATVTGVSLADVAGQSSAALAGQNSTGLINVNDLYAAAQAADAMFDADGGKLRVTVTGNFGSILLQNVTVSTDNTSFATF